MHPSHATSGRPTAIVGYHDPYHDPASGYEHFHSFVNADYIDIGPLIFQRAPIIGRLRGRLSAERYLLHRLKSYDLVHFIYPESHLLLSNRANSRLRTIATLHLPFDWYFGQGPRHGLRLWAMNRGLLRALRQVAGVVLLDDVELDRWREALPNAKFAIIPHGVADHAGWVRDIPTDALKYSITVIGRNYRDWQLLEDVLKIAAQERPLWRFHLVGVYETARQLAEQFGNVVAHRRLSHEDYMQLLAGSAANFLPVTFASANNALLEAHSVGVPTVMSDTGGARRYSCGTTRLVKNPSEAWASLRQIVEADNVAERRAATRVDGSRFFWRNLGCQFRKFYDEVLRDERFEISR